jgi:site-specific recombinase XerD
MKPTDFAKNLTSFFAEYLPGVRNLSPNTISSYRDTFKLLLIFCRDACGVPPEKLTHKVLDEMMIIRFLDWTQNERKCSIATRNQRLAAVHSFIRYVQAQQPEYLLPCQKILQIPFKKYQQALVRHLTPEQMRILLSMPDMSTRTGRRDVTLLSVLYDTGARVQELCDLRVRDVRLDKPALVSLTGKGRKTRHVPLMGNTISLLRSYMQEYHLTGNDSLDMPLFVNQRRIKLTRGGISHILQKYTDMAVAEHPDMPKTITPHILRHSKAMHLYQSGVNLVYIRDILGHVDISTTDTYARADIESKRKALENIYPDITPNELPDWSSDENLLAFLNNL